MNHFQPIDPAHAEGKARTLLDAVKAKMGMTPNMTRMMAASPVVLEGYLSLAGALGGGLLGAKLCEQIALATAEANACEYCLSAHSLMGRNAGLTPSDIEAAREATPPTRDRAKRCGSRKPCSRIAGRCPTPTSRASGPPVSATAKSARLSPT
jgi:AhpD family alkylhydroperoxidase